MSESGIAIPASTTSATTLLDKLIEGKSEEFKRKVLELVARTGLGPNDPLFVILLSTGRLEVLMEETPAALEALFTSWTREIRRSLDLVEQATLERQKTAITEGVAALIRKAERQEASRLLHSVVPAAGLLFAVLGTGFLMGMTVPPFLGGGLTEPMRLTVDQATALRWATSTEGKFARNLLDWNRGYLDNLACIKDTKRLGIKLELGGKPATSGFCTIWVQSPEQRKFEQR